MILVVGEGMVELAAAAGSGGGWQLGHGGDTLNTAIHLARLGQRTAFVSALGRDPFSAELREHWTAEGLDLSLLATDPARRPGLYAIATDAAGERSFTYWRDSSASRRTFALADADALAGAAASAALLYFSMISLAILPPEGREALFALAAAVRSAGGRVAFDSNYRPALWEDEAAARVAHDRGIRLADIGLPTREDEGPLLGLDDPNAIAAAWRDRGVAEVVVKLGAEGCLIDGHVHPVPARVAPLDTTGAGDAFNAGYLHRRLRGGSLADSAAAGHRLAGWVITQRGGIPAPTSDAPYPDLT
jgi:2-dehydro-3-deoxygluconokinase